MRDTHLPSPSRRGVLTAAAWTVPTITVATAAPAFASSVCTVGEEVAYSNRFWDKPWTDGTVQEYLRWNEMSAQGTNLPGIPVGEYQYYQGFFTGWTASGAGDNSVIADHDHTYGWMQGVRTEDGFTSGADNVRSSDITFTVGYQFPVVAGATYDLSTVVYSGTNPPRSQHLAITYSGSGLGGAIAQVTTAQSWENPPSGHTSLSGGQATNLSSVVSPTSSGTLTVSFMFTLQGVSVAWPAPGHQTNDDLAIKAPVLTTVSCG